MKQTFPGQSLSVRLRWVGVNKTLTRVWNPGFYYSFVPFSVSWFGYGKQQKLKKQKNNEADSESAVYLLIRPALSSFQVHTRTEVLT